ncbi:MULTISPECIES: hypothetical protein [Glutamicibacter]|uniref:Hypothetical secreted protein n=1 Tax=Glutamicibacter arilaitensis (strain DSM 16368 / CIP 108037 / IAM 15318 / JCM 13566 / NCIMB 14258 / Re117) TaxID=861360 RepID=A0ABM9Q1B5_GLUAR|nr:MULTISPECIES: hypothetical protein [Glutamicibacter]CBT77497.1 hypothetical secreted protein [Glutamicibacter arilaitensis Re117]
MNKNRYLAVGSLSIISALLLSGCSVSDLLSDKLDESTTRTAESSSEAVANGLLPNWVPDGGTNIELVQRNTGNERIFVMDYEGKLSDGQCTTLSQVGDPTDEELARAYASDPRTKDLEAEEISTTRTLDAEWWPDNAQERTTDLCGRFWVHQADGKLYAFAPDLVAQVQAIEKERAAAENSK